MQTDSLLNSLNNSTLSSQGEILNKLYQFSIKNKYNIGKSLSLIKLGVLNCDNSNFEQALIDIEEGKRIAKEIKNDSLIFISDLALIVQYGRIGLNEKSINLVNDCLSKIDLIVDFKRKDYFKGILYTYKAIYSGGLKNQPSLKEYYNYHKKALYYFTKVKKPISIPAYTNLGDYFNKIKVYDSALYYFQKALENGKLVKQSLGVEYANLGEIHYALKNYSQALCFLDSSNTSSSKNKTYYILEENHKVQRQIYTELGYYKNANKSLYLELQYKDSSNLKDITSLKGSINYIVTKSESEKKDLHNKNRFQLILGSILIVLLLVYSYFQYFQKLNLKFETKRKEKELQVKKNQITILKQKVTDSYEELISMAKKNDPLFINGFKELYPDFHYNLMSIRPNLTVAEQKVCFYLKLKFSTKEIADLTYVTPKAIQNRKNRLRKRLNIPTGIDIYIWIDSL